MECNMHEWKNKILSYLVQSHIGHLFRDGTIDPKQISVNFTEGIAYLRCLELDVEFLNEVGDQSNFPLRVVRGYLDQLYIEAPWKNFWCDGLSMSTEFHGLHLTLEPKEDIDDAASMWSSAIGRLVEKSNIYKNDVENPVSLNEGAKKVDDFFRYLMSKSTIHFKDTVICFQPRNSDVGTKFTIRLESSRFYDENEASENVPEREYETKNRGEGSRCNTVYSTKIVDILGVSFWIADIPQEENRNETRHISAEEDSRQFKNEIMFAALSGRQKIKIFIKQTDSDDGPGLWVHTELGDFIVFLTPRQIYLLAEFMQEYSKNDDDDRRTRRTARAMTDSDFKKLETVLQQQTFHPNTQYAGLQVGYGWSGLPTDDNAEQFYSMSGNSSDDGCAASLLSSSMESASVHSTMYSERSPSTIGRMYGRTSNSNYPKALSVQSSVAQRPTYDPGREIFSIDIHFSSICVVLLHEDISNITENGETYTQDSIEKLQEMSSDFLERILDVKLSSMLQLDERQVKRIFDEACRVNCVRLFSTPVHASFEIDPQKKKYEGTLKTYNFNLSECSFENRCSKSEEVPLLTFDSPSEECVCISSTKSKSYHPRSDLKIKIGKCVVELDITLMDRMSALSNLPLFSKAKEASSGAMHSKHSTSFTIDIPCATFKLRFPIPDFSPLHNPKRVPWWKRNVRPDYMTLKCLDFKFRTVFSSSTKSQMQEYAVKFNVLDLYYNEPSKTRPIFFAQIGDRDQKFHDCKIVIKILPTAKLFNVEEVDDAITRNTFSEEFSCNRDNGPFTSKLVIHHSKADHLDDDYKDAAEILIPGDRKESEEFKTTSKGSSRLIVSIDLSSVKVQIVSKHTYEMIYNRINNDLLTWTPSAPKSRFNPRKGEATFDPCQGAAKHVVGDDEEEDSSDDYNSFHSTFDDGPKVEEESSTFVKKYIGQSELVIDVKIVNGTIAFNSPVRDATLNNVIPGQLGYFSIDVSEANIFFVSGYKGDSALDYSCIDVRSCDMKHHEMYPASKVNICLPDLKNIPHDLYPVISKSVGAIAEERKSQTERPMLTVACKILPNHETHHAKTVKIALGSCKSTLHYRTIAQPNSWISQSIDFFKVADIPISGYKSKEVSSEFHSHTWDCAIDYRPLFLPSRCAVTLGSFNMTSNVSEVACGSKLRFSAEDCDSYLSRENPPKDGVASAAPIDIRREYVNIVTLNSFESSSVMNDCKKLKQQPRTDLRVSTDYSRIHTCSDSLKASTDVIAYIAEDGDLTLKESSECGSAHPSPRHRPGDQESINVDQKPMEMYSVSERQRKEINELLGEALFEESEEDEEDEDCNPIPKTGAHSKSFPQVQRELTYFYSSDEDIDDSFIIIDEESTAQVKPRNDNDIPETDFEGTKPGKVTKGFFVSPVSMKDLSKTPADFPVPQIKYTLCELNVIWQLYGGRDFKKIDEKKKEKREPNSYNESNFSSNESCYSRSSSSSSSYRDTRDGEKVWKILGGPQRNKNELMEIVSNKIRCQYDVYPETTHEAQRFVLQIKEFEINDKMKTSDFNKFMCQYTSEMMPKRNQSYMFSMEAINTRNPESMSETECSLNFSLLPLRFYIDQESLEFLIKFFSEVSQKPEEGYSRQSTPVHQPPPKLVVKNRQEKKEIKYCEGDENLINLEISTTEDRSVTPESEVPVENYSQPSYFRPVSFSPETFVKIDYKGKHMGGALDGSVKGVFCSLALGIACLDNTEIKLKAISHRYGIDGLDKVLNLILQEWFNDIKQNQIKNVLIGVGPMQSLVQLFSGIRDLFWLPIEQYQKDGRIVKGLRKGANKFTTSTALAALESTVKLIHLLQTTAETAYDMSSPGPSVRAITNEKKKKKRYTQPQDIREGVTNALWLVKEGIGETAETIVQVASKEHEQKGYVGVVGGLARQIPSNLIKPIIIASEATNNVSGGIKSQLVPDARIEANQKWRNNFE